MLSEFGIFGVLAYLNPRGKERKAFEQALDIRVRAFAARGRVAQRQAARDLAVLLGKFGRRLADMLELLLIIVNQLGVHGAVRCGGQRRFS